MLCLINMLGKDLFKVESRVDLSNEGLKSLVLFYNPLIGASALTIYEYLVIKGSSNTFDELNKLLNSLNISIDKFELVLGRLNEYRLVNTLKDEKSDRYIFILNNPLTINEFVKDDILVRDFIHKTSGPYFQSLLNNVRYEAKHDGFVDVSKHIDPKILDDWTENDESFVHARSKEEEFEFNTFFNINEFLKDCSTNLLPLRYRTKDNMKEIATLADLYNISYDRMRVIVARTVKNDKNEFDLNLLRYLCENSQPDYRDIKDGEYNVPCELFLMNKQGGKEVTKFDKKIIYALSHDYHLNPQVINCVIEQGLANCDNRLIEKYLYAIASDLHRNDINTVDAAKKRMNKYASRSFVKKDVTPDYSNGNNVTIDNDKLNDILNRRNNNG